MNEECKFIQEHNSYRHIRINNEYIECHFKAHNYIHQIEEQNKQLQQEKDKYKSIVEDLERRINKTNQAIDELLHYDEFKDITNASFGNVKEELKFYLSEYKTIEEFRIKELEEGNSNE